MIEHWCWIVRKAKTMQRKCVHGTHEGWYCNKCVSRVGELQANLACEHNLLGDKPCPECHPQYFTGRCVHNTVTGVYCPKCPGNRALNAVIPTLDETGGLKWAKDITDEFAKHCIVEYGFDPFTTAAEPFFNRIAFIKGIRAQGQQRINSYQEQRRTELQDKIQSTKAELDRLWAELAILGG